MEKKKRFNVIYNNDENIGYGKGYYVVYENYEGNPTFDSCYHVIEIDENHDAISIGLLNKFEHMYYLGYVFDYGYAFNLKDLF